jgi:hypothetical protein
LELSNIFVIHCIKTTVYPRYWGSYLIQPSHSHTLANCRPIHLIILGMKDTFVNFSGLLMGNIIYHYDPDLYWMGVFYEVYLTQRGSCKNGAPSMATSNTVLVCQGSKTVVPRWAQRSISFSLII